jgi:Ser/Thr protein kinase RdoA (MazF antagonist)
MRYEPPVDRARLAAMVRERYGLPVESLTFVPLGYAAACYTLLCAGGARYFLKLWPAMRAGRTSPVRPEVVLPLTRALHERDILPRVPYPLATHDGALWASFAGDPFAVFPFLPGHVPPPWPAWPLALRDELARAIAALHRATPALADVLPPREGFAIFFEADLMRGLEEIERIGPRARTGLRALRSLVLPRRDEILAQLARLHGLQRTVRALAGPFVLCHTDVGPANLLVDEQGKLYILDWDDAIVAPPEHDLQAALGDDFGAGFARFLQVYDAAGGARPLHLDHFAFYLLRRYLGDMTVRLVRIMEQNTTDEDDLDALGGIAIWGFAQWSALDETLAVVAAALRSREA